MKRIGDQALPFRLPALVSKGFVWIDPRQFLGQWVVLSFVPGLAASEAAIWDEQGKYMKVLGAALLVVPSQPEWLRIRRQRVAHFTIVGDPLGRLQRLYGAGTLQSTGRARTFLVDPDGRLRFHAVHSLSDQGMGVITELLNTYQTAEVPA